MTPSQRHLAQVDMALVDLLIKMAGAYMHDQDMGYGSSQAYGIMDEVQRLTGVKLVRNKGDRRDYHTVEYAWENSPDPTNPSTNQLLTLDR